MWRFLDELPVGPHGGGVLLAAMAFVALILVGGAAWLAGAMLG